MHRAQSPAAAFAMQWNAASFRGLGPLELFLDALQRRHITMHAPLFSRSTIISARYLPAVVVVGLERDGAVEGSGSEAATGSVLRGVLRLEQTSSELQHFNRSQGFTSIRDGTPLPHEVLQRRIHILRRRRPLFDCGERAAALPPSGRSTPAAVCAPIIG